MTPKPRRGKGEGGIYQRHDHPTCPPPGPDGTRPRHRCQGKWVGALHIGWAGGRRIRPVVYGKTRADVARRLDQLRGEYKHTGHIPTRTQTVQGWLTYWLDEIQAPKLRPKTLYNYRRRLEVYVNPTIGHLRLDRLTPAHVRGVYADMTRRGLADGTARGVHAILRRALKDAERDGRVTRNVADQVDAPSTRRRTGAPLSVAEALAVLKACEGDRLEARWWAAFMGLRQSEVLGLTWVDVNLDAQHPSLVVERGLHRVPRLGFQYEDPKATASNREVPIIPQFAGALRRRWVAYLGERQADGYEDNGLVWCRPTGKPMDPRRDYQAWTDLLIKANVPHVRLHDARGTTASLLMALGVPDRVIAEILGHADVALTRNVYQRGDAAMRREAMAELGRALTQEDR